MNKNKFPRIDALLIGYENQENLGLRSILSYLLSQGYKAKLIPFTPGCHENVLKIIKKERPRLVGFSIIFQYALEEFGHLIHFLRVNGVRAHFTAGGHYPSLRPNNTLDLFPELDTIVRFEGEITLVELLDNLDKNSEWKNIKSIAFRQKEEVIITPERPLINDLDMLPLVYRDEPRIVGNEVRMASMLSSRGCLFNCSFCSIRQFYGTPPGSLRRARSPDAVVNEMLTLFDNEIRFFSFQDDDFAARSPNQRKWLLKFLQALSDTGLSGKIKWKISCRVDDLEPELLELMLEHGLIAVYLGVESGSETGLQVMNKRVSVEKNIEAINLLKSYDIAMAIGFMLFDPSSTVESICDNIKFLQSVGNDGYFPINFCKMLPYAGTKIEKDLDLAGRLKGTASHPSYNFFDSKLDNYAFLVNRIFSRRNFESTGNVMRLQQEDFNYHLDRSLKTTPLTNGYRQELRQLIAKSNLQAVKTLHLLLEKILQHEVEMLANEQDMLLGIAEEEWRCEAEIESTLALMQNTKVEHSMKSKSNNFLMT